MKNERKTSPRVLQRRASKTLVSLIFLVLLEVLYPGKREFKFSYQVGDIAKEDIITPFSFDVPKNKKELEVERQKAASLVPPVLKPLQQPYPDVKSITITSEKLSSYEVDKLLNNLDKFIENLYKNKVIVREKDSIPLLGGKVVSLWRGNKKKKISIDEIMDLDDANNLLMERGKELYKNDEMVFLFYETGLSFIRSNWKFDPIETRKLREESRESVETVKWKIHKDEKIIGAHEKITPEVMEKLEVLRARAGGRFGFAPQGEQSMVFRLLLFFLIYVIGYLIVRFFHREVYQEPVKFFSIFINAFIILAISSILLRLNREVYYIPFAFFPIITTLITTPDFGFSITFVIAIYISMFSGFNFYDFLFLLFIGSIGIFIVRTLKSRSGLYSAVFILGITGIILSFLISTFKTGINPVDVFIGNALSSGGTVALVLLLLPLYERFFNVTTDYILLELSNLNHPVLSEFQHKASGSFTHSSFIGNLAEAGARAIGANPLLARVGAYYHDIGKLKNPKYYAENQSDENPHDTLSPQLSALILKRHIKNGVELAEKYNLPDSIIRMIKTHHGTTLMVPFYERARKANPNVLESDFRYSGPKPQTKEEAILMLADVVEATARSLEEPNPKRLREVISEAIDRRFKDGQFDECPITRLDLEKIEQAFAHILLPLYHGRPTYHSEERKD